MEFYMENRYLQFIDKILKIFTDAGFGIEKFDEGTSDIIDRTIIGKAKIGSVKILDNGIISVKLGGEAKKHGKFNQIMKSTSFKAKPTQNIASVAKIVKEMLSDYKKAKKEIYKESYSQYTIPAEITREKLVDSIDSYLMKVSLIKEKMDVEENYADLLTFVADKLNLTEDACEAKFGDILNLTLDYDETKFKNLLDSTFGENEIKSDFRKFLKESKNTELKEMILEDKALRRALRNTDSYKNLTEEGKYRKLWQYIVDAYGSKFTMSEELEDICREIAHFDDENF